MAKGLRKLIKNANRISSLTNRLKKNKPAPRLRVVELEDRIAPAAVTLTPSHFTTYDVTGGTDGVWDATDGVIGLGSTSTVTDMTVTVLDDTTPAITGFTFTAGAAQIITIGSNRSIGAVDLSTLPTTCTSLVLVLEGGRANVGAAGTGTFADSFATSYTVATYTAGTGATTGGAATAFAGSGIGAITLPASVNGAGLTVEIIAETNATGALTSITSSATGASLAGSVGVTKIAANTIGAVSWAGAVVPGAANISIAGTVSVAAFSVGDITLAGAGNVTFDGGTTGFTGAVATGAIAASGAGGGDLSITTNTNGGIAGTVTTGAITNSGTNASNISIVPAGTGSMGGFTATGLISNTAAAVNGAITIGPAGTGTLGAVSLAGITVASTDNAGDVTFQGASIGAITSSVAIQTAAGAAGDIAFTAGGATGAMGAIQVTGGITAGQAGATIAFSSTDGMGTIGVTGDIGGAGAVSFAGDAGGTANTGNIGAITVTGTIGNDAGAVAFSGVDIGAIQAAYIGTGAGAVSFTANGEDAAATAKGVIGALTVTNDIASGAGGVTFTADDGMGAVIIGQDAAQVGTLTFNVNADGQDDIGAMGAITAQSLGDPIDDDGGGVDAVVLVTINTNGGATDNTVQRGVGAIEVADGNANLSITADGTVGAINVENSDGALGNRLGLILNLNAAADPTNKPNVTSITLEDTLGTEDLLNVNGAWTIPGTMGAIVVGGSDAADVMALGANNINVYAGDDIADSWDAAFAAASGNINITAGDITGTGVIRANVKAASNLLTYTEDGEVFAVTTATGVTANVEFDPDNNGGAAGTPVEVTIRELAGTSSSDDISITSSGADQFDCGGITPAVDGLNVRNIVIEGDLNGNLGTVTNGFGAVSLIIIQGADNGNTFFGNSLMGWASTDGTLNTTGVNVLTLDTAADGSNDVVLLAGSGFHFADSVGAAADVFNHHIGVTAGATGATATIRGIDGAGDSTANASYTFDGNGSSTAQAGATNEIDPKGLISGSALISRIMLDGVGGLSTDVSVREVDGTTNGSFFEFEQSVGLVNITTQIDSISVGIDDNSDLVDNAVVTGNNANTNTWQAIDRLGGGEYGGDKTGLIPATFITNPLAAMGQFVAQSMGDPGAANINIVVTGSSGPITLTGDAALLTPDLGDLVGDGGDTAAAIAIGGDLAGAITIPGEMEDGDILIGIGLNIGGTAGCVDTDLTEVSVGRDLNGDGDAIDVDVYSELPGGSILTGATITIGDALDSNILVAGDVNADIVITGYDILPEAEDYDDGDLNGIKATGSLNNPIIINGGVSYIIADQTNAANIFVGGSGDDDLEIAGHTITGAGVIGASDGVDEVMLTLISWENGSPMEQEAGIDADGAGGMTVQWTAGAINSTTLVWTLGDVYLQDDVDDLSVWVDDGTPTLNIGNVIAMEELDNDLDVTSYATIGIVIAADDVTIPSSEDLQNLITTVYDVVLSPTWLDYASGCDEDMLNYDGTITAANAGGVIAEGYVDVTANIAGTFGNIVALNGSVSGDVHAGVSIGSIVASTDIDGEFHSEGVLAVSVGTMATDLSTYGLTGVPAWFLASQGGVLAEIGDIDDASFYAAGVPTTVQGTEFWVAKAMGTFYAPTGNIDGDQDGDVLIHVGGGFGGIQVPSGIVEVELYVPQEATIDRLVVPNGIDGTLNINWDKVALNITNGETVVVVGAPLNSDYLDVSVTGANTLAIVDDDRDDIILFGGVEVGASLVVAGDLDQLLLKGDWAGLVSIGANAQACAVGYVDSIIVNGSVVTGADLDCYNFGSLNVQGTIAAAVKGSGTLDNDKSTPALNLRTITEIDDTTSQTMYLKGSKGVTATWNSVFGKVTGYMEGSTSVAGVTLMGKGSADFAIVEGAKTEAQMKSILKTNSMLAGKAHLGDIAMGSPDVKMGSVMVQGEMGALSTMGNVKKLVVAGDVGSVNIGGTISKAFIEGDVCDIFAARIAKNVTINGNVDTFEGNTLSNVKVQGGTYFLKVTAGHGPGTGNWGKLVNCYFPNLSYANFNFDITDEDYNPVKIVHSVANPQYQGNPTGTGVGNEIGQDIDYGYLS